MWNAQLQPAQWRDLFSLPRKIVFQGPWQSEGVFRSFLDGASRATAACVRNGMPDLPGGLAAKPRTPGKARVVFVGGVYGRKRPQDLVDAVTALDRDDVECLFIGTTESLASIGAEAVARMQARPDLFKFSANSTAGARSST